MTSLSFRLAAWAAGQLQYTAPWWASAGALFDMDFAGQRGWVSTDPYERDLSELLTFTRASSATYRNSSGVLVDAANDVMRFNYNASTLQPLGIWLEGERTNLVPNNTMQGAAVGTPGTLPTGWPSLPTGVTTAIVGLPVVDGVQCIDIRFYGVPSTTDAQTLTVEPTETVSSGATYTVSAFVALVGGSLTNVSSISLRVRDETVGQTTLSLTSALTRVFCTQTTTTTSANTRFRWAYDNTSTSVDFTLRIGLPQRELAGFASSVIKTTGVAATRAADTLTVTLGDWFNATEGTLLAEWGLFATPTDTTGLRVAAFTDGGLANLISLRARVSAGTIQSVVITGGAPQAVVAGPTAVSGSVYKQVLAYKAGNFAATVNGAAVTTVSSGLVPTVTTLELGREGTGAHLFGYLRRVSYIPRRVSSAELQALTA